MAIAVNDILQFTDVQSYLGQQVLNVYFYKVVSFESGVDYTVLADNWETLVRTPIRNVQFTGLSHDALIIKNLTNGIDIHVETDAAAGLAAGEGLASFYALGIRLVRSTGLTRHGSKRIAGLTEGVVTGNTYSLGSSVAAIQTALGPEIVVTGTLDNDFVLQHVIVGRIPSGSPGAGNLDLTKINPVASAQIIRVTTQTTRRAGRGS